MRLRFKIQLTTCVFLWIACNGLLAAEPLDRPLNVLLIVADDLGYSDLGCYGGEIDTPNLDSLAKAGIRLTQFHTMSRCCPSRASLLTGHYPHRVGLGHMTIDLNRPGYRGRVASWAPTIADVLKQSKYSCFLSGKWHLGTADPTRHGFDGFYGTLVSAKTFWQRDHYIRLPKSTDASHMTSDDSFYGTNAITDHAISFLNQTFQTRKQPWMLTLAYNAPHFPLQAPKSLINKYIDRYQQGWDQIRQTRLAKMKQLQLISTATVLSPRSTWVNYGETESGHNPAWNQLSSERQNDLARRMAIYAAMIDSMDQNIGRVMSFLRDSDQLSHTLIVFVSDNGGCAEWDPRGFDGRSSNNNILHRSPDTESMGGPGTFHSVGSGWANASNTPFRLYKHYCHQGGTLSPCIFVDPSLPNDLAGTICDTPAHLIDIMTTVMDATGTTYPQQHNGYQTQNVGGLSLRDLVSKKTNVDRRLFFEHEGHRGVRHRNWKLVALARRSWELYDLQSDPTELTNLAEQRPDLVETLSAEWHQWAENNQVTPLPDDYQVAYLKPTRTP
ncbi:MAG: arylsulfatase [Planctomycetota bacterium]